MVIALTIEYTEFFANQHLLLHHLIDLAHSTSPILFNFQPSNCMMTL